MLIEVWPVGNFVEVFVPPNTTKYPHRVREIDEEDWRFLTRFQQCEMVDWPTPDMHQVRYRFRRAGAEGFIAALQLDTTD